MTTLVWQLPAPLAVESPFYRLHAETFLATAKFLPGVPELVYTPFENVDGSDWSVSQETSQKFFRVTQ